MKTRTITLVLFFIGFSAFSQDWIEFSASDNTKPNYEILKSTDTVVEFAIDVPGMFSTAIDTFKRVQVKEHTKIKSAGLPEVPVLSFLVAIPDCDDINISIELLDSVKISDINIYPAPAIVEDSTADGSIFLREEFAYNETAYSENSFFPEILAETLEKGAVRGPALCKGIFIPCAV